MNWIITIVVAVSQVIWGQENVCKIASANKRPVTVLKNGLKVMCDVASGGGNWLVFQHRTNGKVSFDRPWSDYKNGFGEVGKEDFWLGLETVYRLCQTICELRMDFRFNKTDYFAQYKFFSLSGENEKYKLRLDKLVARNTPKDDLLADGLWDSIKAKLIANGMYFTTKDKDNDNNPSKNCARLFSLNAWWHNSCGQVFFNGVWGHGIQWHSVTGDHQSASFTEMKVRVPVDIGEDACNIAQKRRKVAMKNGQTVLCDVASGKGDWLVFQRRADGSVSFDRPWVDYMSGFGEVGKGDFWLGLDTVSRLCEKNCELRIDFRFNKKNYFAEYRNFSLLGVQEKYKLTLKGYKAGNVTKNDLQAEGYTESKQRHLTAHGMYFSTRDVDNDRDSQANCAMTHGGGWWWNDCGLVNINGRNLTASGGDRRSLESMEWHSVTDSLSVQFTEMKIRFTHPAGGGDDVTDGQTTVSASVTIVLALSLAARCLIYI